MADIHITIIGKAVEGIAVLPAYRQMVPLLGLDATIVGRIENHRLRRIHMRKMASGHLAA